MNLRDLLTAVADITKRPDKAAHATHAINRACHRISIMHFFRQDLQELTWTIDPAGATAFSIPSDVLTSDLRKIDYIQVVGRPSFLTQITPKEVFCKGRTQTDVYYRTGNGVYVNLAQPAVDLLIGVYTYPTILDVLLASNWVTNMFPYAVIEGAAAGVFKAIGDDTSHTKHEEEFRLQCAQIMSDLKQGEL